ncbi:hypothetical protein DL93DRAFT_1436761 [Clavulina sp. PMI_390]|nr:hypothetical protein DL93DRAFT_1436761 [Clavulina sp. PMI_390]
MTGLSVTTDPRATLSVGRMGISAVLALRKAPADVQEAGEEPVKAGPPPAVVSDAVKKATIPMLVRTVMAKAGRRLLVEVEVGSEGEAQEVGDQLRVLEQVAEGANVERRSLLPWTKLMRMMRMLFLAGAVVLSSPYDNDIFNIIWVLYFVEERDEREGDAAIDRPIIKICPSTPRPT